MGNFAKTICLVALMSAAYVTGYMVSEDRKAKAQKRYEDCVKQRRQSIKQNCRECAYLLIDEPKTNLPKIAK